jgi:assimilatory nitrate reductase catalytic subunit
VFDELRRASAGGIADYSGISYARIEAEQGVFWPCPAEDHPGTPRLFTESFPTADGRARFLRVEHRDAAEAPDPSYPYVLTTGRLMAQYQSGTQTRRVPSPAQAQARPEAQIHPDLARRLDIGPADIVQLTSRRGAANFRAKISDEIRRDTIFVPFHWGGLSAANALTNPALDPHSRMPAFKVCAVSAAKIGEPDDLHLLEPSPLVRIPATRPEPSGPLPPSRTRSSTRPLRRKDSAMLTKNRFLQGIFPFEGAGLEKPVPISDELGHLVPDGVTNQTLYFRGGNTTDQLITIVLLRDGVPMRYFPIGARGDVHVPLRVVEDIDGGSVIELQLIAPLGLVGHVVVDLGMVEH